MQRFRIFFTAIGAVALVTALVIGASSDSKPPVSMTVVGIVTNQFSDDVALPLKYRTHVCAVVALTNNSKQAFKYYAIVYNGNPDHTLLVRGRNGWEDEYEGLHCGLSSEMPTLLPGEGFTFEALVATDQPCKMGFEYSDGSTPSPIWQKLPGWISRRLPWASEWKTATTGVIDLRPVR